MILTIVVIIFSQKLDFSISFKYCLLKLWLNLLTLVVLLISSVILFHKAGPKKDKAP